MEAGWGGHHPGAQHGLGGAATRLAPKSSVGEEMSVCEPAEAGRPAVHQAQASRDLPAPKKPSAREEGKSSDYSPHLVLVPLPWSKRQEGEGKRNLTPIIGRPTAPGPSHVHVYLVFHIGLAHCQTTLQSLKRHSHGNTPRAVFLWAGRAQVPNT